MDFNLSAQLIHKAAGAPIRKHFEHIAQIPPDSEYAFTQAVAFMKHGHTA